MYGHMLQASQVVSWVSCLKKRVKAGTLSERDGEGLTAHSPRYRACHCHREVILLVEYVFPLDKYVGMRPCRSSK